MNIDKQIKHMDMQEFDRIQRELRILETLELKVNQAQMFSFDEKRVLALATEAYRINIADQLNSGEASCGVK